MFMSLTKTRKTLFVWLRLWPFVLMIYPFSCEQAPRQKPISLSQFRWDFNHTKRKTKKKYSHLTIYDFINFIILSFCSEKLFFVFLFLTFRPLGCFRYGRQKRQVYLDSLSDRLKTYE